LFVAPLTKEGIGTKPWS